MLQLKPQKAGLRTNDIVFVGVIPRGSAEDMNPNLLLGGRRSLVVDCAPADVNQKGPEFGRPLKGAAGHHPAH
jgi:hypothetical protein